MINKKDIILMILHKNFPDLRVCQEIDALVENGYEVYVIAPSIKEQSFGYSSKNYNLIDVDFQQSKLNSFISLANNNYKIILNRIIKNKIFNEIKERVFAIHVHDLTLSKVGYKLSKLYDYKFVIDYHENWPAMKDFVGNDIDYKYNFKQYIYNHLTNYNRIVSFEKRMSVLADKIIVVVDENKTRLVKNYSLNSNKVHVVSNTKNPEDYVNYGLNMEDKSINLFYHGTIQRLRGIRTLVEAFKKTKNKKVNLTLTIIGFQKGCKEKKYIIDLYEGVLPNNLELIDWTLDREFVLSKIKKSDLCIIPHDKSDLADTTVPNKIFEYMCYGKPVLVSDVRPLKRILDATGAGLIFKASDVEDLKDVLEQLSSKQELLEFSRNARQSVEGRFNWNNDVNELLKMYGELL